MVAVNYSHRIICDCHFINWLSKQKNKNTVISHLMHIKASSKYHKKYHNIILESELNTCIGKGWLSESQIGACFKKIENPDFLIIHDDNITKTIIFSIELTSEKPYQCYIFTSPDKVKEYMDDSHYKGIKVVLVKGGEDAIKILENFFNAFKTARDLARESIAQS